MAALTRALGSLGSRWVNPSVTDKDEAALQARLTGLLLAIPPLSFAHLALNVPLGVAPDVTVPVMALGFALPIVAASTLSLNGTTKIRSILTSMAAPLALMAATGAHFATAPVAYLVTAIAAVEAARNPASRTAWTISAGGAFLLAALIALAKPFGAEPAMSFAGLAPAAAAALAYGLSLVRRPKQAAVAAKAPEAANAMIGLMPQAVALVTIGRDAAIQSVQAAGLIGQVLAEGDKLVDRVHVADRPALLSWLDGVTRGEPVRDCFIRLQAVEANLWQRFALRGLACVDGASISLMPVEEPASMSGGNVVQDEVLALVSHELRTPLNAVIGFADMLRHELSGPLTTKRQRDHIDLIHQSGIHLLDVVEGLLSWSRLENGTLQLAPEEFVPAEAAAFAISMVAAQAQEKSVGLEFEPMTALETFSGDPQVCRQILVNLLSNAVKFAPEGGFVRLRLDISDDRLTMLVEDNGAGMPAELVQRLGTPFYQATSSSGGTGLGLALVKQLARLHGGAVEFTSAPGQGFKASVALGRLAPVLAIDPQADESVRIIRVFEERDSGTQRKTA